jgi:hypothetical protein
VVRKSTAVFSSVEFVHLVPVIVSVVILSVEAAVGASGALEGSCGGHELTVVCAPASSSF